jgi:hypothetical protein
MKTSGLILIAVILTGMMIGTAGAHTYDPDREDCMIVIDLDEDELEWGDTMKISDCYRNVTYEIEVVDFHILGIEPVLSSGDDPCSGRECIVTNETGYVNLKVYRDIYGTDELILNAPFQANESILENGLFTCAPATSWDNTGYVWNYEHEFYIAVSEIKCDFAEDDCFCTDPENEKATIKCFTVAPPEFEFDVKTILPGDEYEDMEVFRSNSEFIAEIKLKNTGSNAYHTMAWFAARPTEMIDGKYPPDCTIERIYKGKHDDEGKVKEDTKLPMNLRTLDEEDWYYADKDWFNADDEVIYTVYFKTPTIPKRTEYQIEVNLTCEDFKERTLYFPREGCGKTSRWFFDNFEECPHNLTYNETTVEILPALEVKKAIGTEDYAIVPEEAVEPYTSDTTYVIYEDYEPYVFLTVKNWGEYAISSIRLSDSPNGTWHKPATTDFNKWKCALSADILKIPEMENDRWNWGFSLEPGEVMMCAYPVSLLKPGTYKLGSAAVNWTENGFNYSVDSYAQSVEVHGPYIEVTKRVDPASVTQNGTADVVISVKNTGDRTTSITIFDEIPEESILVTAPTGVRGIIVGEENSTFSLRRVLKAGAEEIFSYTINPNRTVMLPPVVVKFADLTQYGAINISDMPLLTVEGTVPIGAAAESEKAVAVPEENAETPEPVKTPVRKEPGFAGLLAVIACLAAVLIEKRRRK